MMFDAIGQSTVGLDGTRILRVGGDGQVFVGFAIETSQNPHGLTQMPSQRIGTEDTFLPSRDTCSHPLQVKYSRSISRESLERI